MCSLPFPVDKMYHFVLERFEGTTAAVQDQNLQWLQVKNEKFSHITIYTLLSPFALNSNFVVTYNICIIQRRLHVVLQAVSKPGEGNHYVVWCPTAVPQGHHYLV